MGAGSEVREDGQVEGKDARLDLGIRVDVVKILALELTGGGATLTISFLLREM